MRCDVFRGIGGVAHKYYLLFQHHLAPALSTYTTGKILHHFADTFAKCTQDAPQTMSDEGVGIDPRQLENTFVLEEDAIDSSYIIGSKPGPYVAEHSRSIYARLGARIAFFGIDARTEASLIFLIRFLNLANLTSGLANKSTIRRLTTLFLRDYGRS